MKRIYITLIAMCVSIGIMTTRANTTETPEYLIDVKEALANNDIETAYTLILDDIATYPKDGDARFLYAFILTQRDETALAIDNYKMADKLTKDKNRRSVINYSMAICFLTLGDTTSCISHLDKAEKLTPKDIDIYNLRGNIYSSLGEYEKAEKDFFTALTIDKDSYKTFGNLGDMYFNMEEYEKALEYYNYMIKLDPSDENVLYSRALCYYNLGQYLYSLDDCITVLANGDFSFHASMIILAISEKDFELATSKLDVVSKVDPSNTLWKNMLGSLYYDRNDYEQAIAHWKEGLAYEPSAQLASDIAECYLLLYEYDMANEYIDYAIAIDSTNNEYILNKANILMSIGEVEQAKNLLHGNLENDSTDLNSRYFLSEIYRMTGENELCLNEMNILIENLPNNRALYERRGRAYRAMGNEEAAKQDFETVLAMTEEPDETYAFCLQHLGQSEKAIETMLQLKGDAAGETDYYNIACLYAMSNDVENALKYLRLSLENGYKNFYYLKTDSDFNNIRESEGYKALINEFCNE